MAYAVAAIMAFYIAISDICSWEAQSPADYPSWVVIHASSFDIVGYRAGTCSAVAARDAGDSGTAWHWIQRLTQAGLLAVIYDPPNARGMRKRR